MKKQLQLVFSKVALIFNRKTPSKIDRRLNGHPVLKIRDVTEDGQFKGNFESFVDRDFTIDLLLTRKNTYELVGASAFVHTTRPKFVLPDLVFRLRLSDEKTYL